MTAWERGRRCGGARAFMELFAEEVLPEARRAAVAMVKPALAR